MLRGAISIVQLTRLRYGLLVLIACCWSQSAVSAELVSANTSVCEKKLIGPIEVGDFKKLEEALTWKMRLCLNSPGGSYLDGLDLFAHIASSRIGTAIDASDECYSACAIAFMGGADGAYGDRFPNRTLHAKGKLGFHSPFVARQEYQPPAATDRLAEGVSFGIYLIAKLIRLDQYNLLPKPLIASMLETSPSSIYYVDTFEKARVNEISLVGVKDPAKITKQMLYTACLNSDPWADASAIVEKDGVVSAGNPYRIVFSGFGFQSIEKCAVDVVTKPGGVFEIFVQLRDELQPVQRADQKPTWYLYPSSSAFAQHAQNR